jgi:hypothetical protein
MVGFPLQSSRGIHMRIVECRLSTPPHFADPAPFAGLGAGARGPHSFALGRDEYPVVPGESFGRRAHVLHAAVEDVECGRSNPFRDIPGKPFELSQVSRICAEMEGDAPNIFRDLLRGPFEFLPGKLADTALLMPALQNDQVQLSILQHRLKNIFGYGQFCREVRRPRVPHAVAHRRHSFVLSVGNVSEGSFEALFYIAKKGIKRRMMERGALGDRNHAETAAALFQHERDRRVDQALTVSLAPQIVARPLLVGASARRIGRRFHGPANIRRPVRSQADCSMPQWPEHQSSMSISHPV